MRHSLTNKLVNCKFLRFEENKESLGTLITEDFSHPLCCEPMLVLTLNSAEKRGNMSVGHHKPDCDVKAKIKAFQEGA